jgi:hypothetical protein
MIRAKATYMRMLVVILGLLGTALAAGAGDTLPFG